MPVSIRRSETPFLTASHAMDQQTASFRDGITDHDISAQRDRINAEVAESQPLVGPLEAPDVLLRLYADNPPFLEKLRDFCTRYRAIRRVRGDGSCFYRAFLVSVGEYFVAHHVTATSAAASSSPSAAAASAAPSAAKLFYDRTCDYVRNSYPLLLALGYSDVTLCDFYDAMTQFLASLGAAGATDDTVHAAFGDTMSNLFLVTYLRCLCSLELRSHEDEYFPFVLGIAPHCEDVKAFCDSEVDAVSTDADQVQVIALARAWGLRVRIAYLDASPVAACTVHVFPEEEASGGSGTGPVVSLLYRPGHYDIAYPVVP